MTEWSLYNTIGPLGYDGEGVCVFAISCTKCRSQRYSTLLANVDKVCIVFEQNLRD